MNRVEELDLYKEYKHAYDKATELEYFDKQQSMKNSMTKSYILNYDFPSVKSRTFVNDYIKVLQSLGMSDQ